MSNCSTQHIHEINIAYCEISVKSPEAHTKADKLGSGQTFKSLRFNNMKSNLHYLTWEHNLFMEELLHDTKGVFYRKQYCLGPEKSQQCVTKTLYVAGPSQV